MKNLHLIVGDDRETTNFYVSGLLNNISNSSENKILYDLKINSLSDILDEASTVGLFSNQKVIIGINFDLGNVGTQDIDYLTKYIDNLNPDVYIILVTNKIDSRLKSFKVIKDSFNIIDIAKRNTDDDVYSFAKDMVVNYKYTISEMDLDYLVSISGYDVNNIENELLKLFIYKYDDKNITKDDINILVVDNVENAMYEFTNAFLENNFDMVSMIYNKFKRNNVSFDYIVSSLSNVFRQVLLIKIMHNDGNSNLDISKVIGKKEFFVKKMLERIYRYTSEDLENMITKLAKIELDYKSGNMNFDMLELFLFNEN